MEPIAIISDVHGNFPAFLAVLDEIHQLGISRIIALGDTVGYGPQPVECLERAIKVCDVLLMGNHELKVLKPEMARMNPVAETANDWTRNQLTRAGLLETLSLLPVFHKQDDFLFVHGTPKDVLRDYLLEENMFGYSNFDQVARSLKIDFKDFRICFVGHNHQPFLATEDGFIHPHDTQNVFFVEEKKLYVSVGSVGQPRDHDPRSSFVTFNGKKVCFHRVQYSVEETRLAFSETGLPAYLSDRLLEGR